MKNKSNKFTITFTIDKNIIEIFRKLSKIKSINKSLLLENFIKSWIEENK